MVGQQIQLPGFGLGTVTSRAGDYYRIESEYPRKMIVYRKGLGTQDAAPLEPTYAERLAALDKIFPFKSKPCCLDALEKKAAYERASAWIRGMAA
jgi:hypothetical protein